MTLFDRLNLTDHPSFLDRLSHVFKSMDQAYDQVAGAYGFQCRGCEDNCCYSRFYHHTLLEYAYLHQGIHTLSPDRRDAVLERARQVVDANQREDRTGTSERMICPLNEDGLCLTYVHRPMVCRLHGLAHELRKPGLEPVRSPGCGLFTQKTRDMDYISFDRTPFYMDLAHLERDFRLATGITDRLKLTIAEILVL